jgi:methionyl-tRNA formyltransferase
MKIMYMGTPDFAVPAREAIAAAGHEIGYVVTQPDAVRDRGKKVKMTPVKEKALELGIEVLQPERVKGDDEFFATISAYEPDLIAVAAYGQILPKNVLDLPKLGCVNIHGSILPRWRGAAPIQRSIQAGDKETGITIMYMEEGLDTGAMLAKRYTPIEKKTGEQLHDELSVMGAELLVETLPKLGEITGEKQNDEESNYAPMISKKEGHIDFSMKAEEIERIVRAFCPWPGTYAFLGEKMMKIHVADVLDETSDAPSGTVIRASAEGLDIAAGGGVLRVTEIQMPGKKRVEIKEYLKGNSIEIGTVLG